MQNMVRFHQNKVLREHLRHAFALRLEQNPANEMIRFIVCSGRIVWGQRKYPFEAENVVLPALFYHHGDGNGESP